jgi:phage shock protein PspC (stress-responsive transcriptional regulator)
MNKIVNINLGGYPFSIDEDAYGKLTTYLNTIHHHFETSEGYDEITTDIEIRMAELFQERLGSRAIVTSQDVAAAISIMGTPEDFGAETIAEEPIRQTEKDNKFGIKTGKRLFRNEEDAVLGGVCSGLAAYLGIKDPLWLRLILVLLVLSSVGFLVPAYFIAWAIVPAAKTAADRLSMRGEPINASNIGKMVEEEMKDLSERISDIGEDWSEKFGGGKNKFDGTGSAIRDGLSGAIYYLGKILRGIIQFVMKIGRPFLILFSILLCLGLLFTWVAGLIGISLTMPLADYFVPSRTGLAYLGVINVFSVVTIPLAFLVLLSFRLWSGARLNRYWRGGMLGFFAINMISLGVLGSSFMRDFQAGTKVTLSEQTLSGIDTLLLTVDQTDDLDQNWLIAEHLFADEDRLYVELSHIDVRISEDDQFHLEEVVYGRGRSRNEAERLAYLPDYEIVRKGNQLILPGSWSLPKGNKYRGQDVRISIAVPENAHLQLDGRTVYSLRNLPYISHEHRTSSRYDRIDTWKMTSEGLMNLSLEEELKNVERLSDAHEF